MVKENSRNTIETYKIGNTTIKICDDAYKDKTPEDIQTILKRITYIRLQSLYQKPDICQEYGKVFHTRNITKYQ